MLWARKSGNAENGGRRIGREEAHKAQETESEFCHRGHGARTQSKQETGEGGKGDRERRTESDFVTEPTERGHRGSRRRTEGGHGARTRRKQETGEGGTGDRERRTEADFCHRSHGARTQRQQETGGFLTDHISSSSLRSNFRLLTTDITDEHGCSEVREVSAISA